MCYSHASALITSLIETAMQTVIGAVTHPSGSKHESIARTDTQGACLPALSTIKQIAFFIHNQDNDQVWVKTVRGISRDRSLPSYHNKYVFGL